MILGMLITLPAAGCALSPGDGWGWIEADLDAGLGRPPDRGSGPWRKTSSSYELRWESFTLQLGEIALLSDAGAGSVDFDPNNPPPGYSSCHGGHCHRESDGALVPYAEVAAGAGASAGSALATFPVEQALDLTADQRLTLPCATPSCEVPRGEASHLSLTVEAVEGHGQIRDASVWGRLPDAVPLEVTLDAPVTVEAALPEVLRFDLGEAPGAKLEIHFRVPAGLLDGVEASEFLDGGEVRLVDSELVSAHLTAAPVRIEVERVDAWPAPEEETP
ncbi:MAG: hypothetical protein D6729_11670 [Deltaproteobacteria bacterium]|nr:MAG: hypothetical protein D6729_11670 [Deltaproteobacteria bacterium]